MSHGTNITQRSKAFNTSVRTRIMSGVSLDFRTRSEQWWAGGSASNYSVTIGVFKVQHVSESEFNCVSDRDSDIRLFSSYHYATDNYRADEDNSGVGCFLHHRMSAARVRLEPPHLQAPVDLCQQCQAPVSETYTVISLVREL